MSTSLKTPGPESLRPSPSRVSAQSKSPKQEIDELYLNSPYVEFDIGNGNVERPSDIGFEVAIRLKKDVLIK